MNSPGVSLRVVIAIFSRLHVFSLSKFLLLFLLNGPSESVKHDLSRFLKILPYCH